MHPTPVSTPIPIKDHGCFLSETWLRYQYCNLLHTISQDFVLGKHWNTFNSPHFLFWAWCIRFWFPFALHTDELIIGGGGVPLPPPPPPCEAHVQFVPGIGKASIRATQKLRQRTKQRYVYFGCRRDQRILIALQDKSVATRSMSVLVLVMTRNYSSQQQCHALTVCRVSIRAKNCPMCGWCCVLGDFCLVLCACCVDLWVSGDGPVIPPSGVVTTRRLRQAQAQHPVTRTAVGIPALPTLNQSAEFPIP